MANSSVSICTQALVALGASAISSFDDDSDSARACGQLYPMVKAGILSQYDWRFTVTKAKLTRLADAPLTRWTYAFLMPPDRMHDGLIAVYDTDAVGASPYRQFQIYGNQLWTDVTEVWIDYQGDSVSDEASWPGYFVQLMVAAMAHVLAMPTTDLANLTESWRTAAYGPPADGMQGGLLRIAKQRNARDQPSQIVADFSLVAARMGGV